MVLSVVVRVLVAFEVVSVCDVVVRVRVEPVALRVVLELAVVEPSVWVPEGIRFAAHYTAENACD